MADRVIELTEESKKKEDEIKRLTDLLNAVNVDKNRLQADCQSLRVRVEEIMRENNVSFFSLDPLCKEKERNDHCSLGFKRRAASIAARLSEAGRNGEETEDGES